MRRCKSSITRSWLATLCGLAVLSIAACNLPRDSSGTLDRVRHGTMRVGLITNPPWVTDSGATTDGVEQQLVKELASRLDARVDWVRRPSSELLEALHRRELDLVIGGLTSTLPWQKEVAFTKPYYTDTIAVGPAAGNGVPGSLNGATVAVERGSAITAELRTQGATPLPVDDVTRATGLVVAPTWKLVSMGRADTGFVLQQQPHVLAAAQGENAWLVEIERLLRDRKSAIPGMLRAQR